jgi:hypothetical protein
MKRCTAYLLKTDEPGFFKRDAVPAAEGLKSVPTKGHESDLRKLVEDNASAWTPHVAIDEWDATGKTELSTYPGDMDKTWAISNAAEANGSMNWISRAYVGGTYGFNFKGIPIPEGYPKPKKKP